MKGALFIIYYSNCGISTLTNSEDLKTSSITVIETQSQLVTESDRDQRNKENRYTDSIITLTAMYLK